MSKIPLNPDDAELGHLTEGRAGVFIATGEDRATISPACAADPGSVPMQVRACATDQKEAVHALAVLARHVHARRAA